MFVGVYIPETARVPTEKPAPCKYRKRFGANVARLRIGSAVSQEKLAEKVGISARYLQAIEAGDNWPSLAVLVQLFRHLDCEWNDLFAGVEK